MSVFKKPTDLNPDEWRRVLCHPDGLEAGCAEVMPPANRRSVEKYLSHPKNRYRIFGDAEMTYAKWRKEGTTICPAHANRIDLSEPVGPPKRDTLRGDIEVQMAVNRAPWKPACVIAAENDLDPKKVTKYKNNHPPTEMQELLHRSQQVAWENAVLRAGLEEWVNNGYPARVFQNIERRHR